MKSPFRSPLDASGNIHLGRLLSPDESALQCEGATPPVPIPAVWTLNMRLPSALVDLVAQDETVFSMPIFASDSGVLYVVVVAQTDNVQVRAMLALSDATTAGWLKECVRRGAMRLRLDGQGSDFVTLLEASCTQNLNHDIDTVAASSAQLDLAGRLADAASMARRLLRPEAMRQSPGGRTVDDVHVVLVSTTHIFGPGMSATSTNSARVLN